MEFKDAAAQRTSVRNFTDEKIPVSDLQEMVRIARLAPSISGAELWRFIAVTNKDVLKQMGEAVKKKYDEIIPENDKRVTENVKLAVTQFSTFFLKAPAIIAVLMQPYTAIIDNILSDTKYTHEEINKIRNYPDIQSIGAAIQNLLLAAVDLGYGACWLTGPMVAKDELSEIIGIKAPHTLAAFVAVGKPDKEQTPKTKKSVDEIFRIMD